MKAIIIETLLDARSLILSRSALILLSLGWVPFVLLMWAHSALT